jgi:membrane associated rhomboid family serine protease
MLFLLPLGPESDDLEDAVQGKPWATYVLAGLCLLTYLFFLFPATPQVFLIRLYGYGYQIGHPLGIGALTHPFFHVGPWHLVGNLLFLLILGVTAERRLGHLAVVLVFFVGALAGLLGAGATSTPVSGMGKSFHPPLLGGAGPLGGLLGCLMPTLMSLRLRVLVGWGSSYQVVSLPAWGVVVCYLGKEAAGVFWSGGAESGTEIGAVVGGAFVGLILGEVFRRLPQVAGEGTVGAVVQAGRERGLVSTFSTSRASLQAPAKTSGEELIEDSVNRIEEEDEGPETGLVDLPDSYAAGATDLGKIPEGQDYSEVSKSWAGSVWNADLQDRLRRARDLERDPEKYRTAFHFYKSLLVTKSLPAGFRAYAGARAARMLLRRESYRKAYKLSTRLLLNELPEEIRDHLYQTAQFAWKHLSPEEREAVSGGLQDRAL